MWWWVATGAASVGGLVFWVWIWRFTDFGHRSRDFEQSDQEIAAALREAQRGRDTGQFYGHH
ncbi:MULTISPECIES: hypothetical protein [unclassified Curtobacterium]|uniref:hypothetical protein n=1 Tax=unclassified Curtobacterium TaxID=257496 RepID=UPI000D9E0FE5|nr:MULTISPECIES: hypothetical protein [unclassified Curtobacterium]PYY33893.1 hypothetical protein DEJ32_15505 [Curtobacterium sp. MCPF17_046]WIB15813.1 hypothetical protein DEJ34_01410 [Curtobacterium sp. MCPF17_050]